MIQDNHKPAIIVIAYNRINSLRRLLMSLLRADYGNYEDIHLVISIDYGGSSQVMSVADEFEWPYGEKKIIAHKKNLGLKDHILTCGNLTKDYGSVIILEDDLYVSSSFYKFAVDAVRFYKNSISVFGVSLYSPNINFLSMLPFLPLNDGYDNYFLQIPETWGQVWWENEWIKFINWLQSSDAIRDNALLPPKASKWPPSSWSKLVWIYLIETNKYVAYPRVGYSTQFGEPGVHLVKSAQNWHVEVNFRYISSNFSNFEESLAVYDPFFELIPVLLQEMNTRLSDYDFDVDLYGNKPFSHLNHDYVLTTKSTKNRGTVFSFDRSLKPHEANIIENISGQSIQLIKRSDLVEFYNPQLFKKAENDLNYFYKPLSVKFIFQLLVRKVFRRIFKEK